MKFMSDFFENWILFQEKYINQLLSPDKGYKYQSKDHFDIIFIKRKMQEGWESVYPPPIVPKLQCGVLSVRKEMNKEANLPCGNYWTIRAAWDHTNDKESFFYNLEDSQNKKWSVRIYKHNNSEEWRYEKLQKGFFDPESTQWVEIKPEEAQGIVNRLTSELNKLNGEGCWCNSYTIIKVWKSFSGRLGDKTRYFINMKASDGDNFYARIDTYPYDVPPKIIYVGSGQINYPPVLPVA